jgi:hypothetical protein
LNDKVLDAAISNLASKVIENLLEKPWRAYILAYEDGSYVITGGKSQGLSVGDTLDVYAQGKKVKNPQTGMDIALPGKMVGQIKVTSFAGDALNEIALATPLSGDIPRTEDASVYQNYFVQEPK